MTSTICMEDNDVQGNNPFKFVGSRLQTYFVGGGSGVHEYMAETPLLQKYQYPST